MIDRTHQERTEARRSDSACTCLCRSAVSRRGLRVRQVGLLAEENLLRVAVHTAGAVCLAQRCGHLPAFKQPLEAAHVLADDELRILTEEGREAAGDPTARHAVLNRSIH